MDQWNQALVAEIWDVSNSREMPFLNRRSYVQFVSGHQLLSGYGTGSFVRRDRCDYYVSVQIAVQLTRCI